MPAIMTSEKMKVNWSL